MQTYQLSNQNIAISILDIGASIYEFKYRGFNIVKNNPQLADYYDNPEYQGTTVAPLAGRYLIDEEIVLHSGKDGLSNKEFKLLRQEANSLELEYDYLKVKYILLEKGLRIEYMVDSEEQRALNITNHCYFCLDDKADINNHKLLFNSDYMATKNADNLAIGVSTNTISELDFSSIKPDDYYYFAENKEAILTSASADFKLKLTTSYDGLVVYTYNFPTLSQNKHSAVALEPQNAPNNFQLYKHYQHFIEYQLID